MDKRTSVRANERTNERTKAAAKVAAAEEEKKEKKTRDSRRHSFASPHDSYSSQVPPVSSLFLPAIGQSRNGRIKER